MQSNHFFFYHFSSGLKLLIGTVWRILWSQLNKLELFSSPWSPSFTWTACKGKWSNSKLPFIVLWVNRATFCISFLVHSVCVCVSMIMCEFWGAGGCFVYQRWVFEAIQTRPCRFRNIWKVSLSLWDLGTLAKLSILDHNVPVLALVSVLYVIGNIYWIFSRKYHKLIKFKNLFWTAFHVCFACKFCLWRKASVSALLVSFVFPLPHFCFVSLIGGTWDHTCNQYARLEVTHSSAPCSIYTPAHLIILRHIIKLVC